MVNKIIGWSFFFCMIIALFLALAGVEYIGTGKNFAYFIRVLTDKFESFDFSIPDIPSIPQHNPDGGWSTVLKVLKDVANFFIVTTNILVKIINVVIAVIRFIIALVIAIKDYIQYVGDGDTRPILTVTENNIYLPYLL